MNKVLRLSLIWGLFILSGCAATGEGAPVVVSSAPSTGSTPKSPPPPISTPCTHPPVDKVIILDIPGPLSTLLTAIGGNTLFCNNCVHVAAASKEDEVPNTSEAIYPSWPVTVSNQFATPFDIDVTQTGTSKSYVLLKIRLNNGLQFYTQGAQDSSWAIIPGIPYPGWFSCPSPITIDNLNRPYINLRVELGTKPPAIYGGLSIGILTTQPAVVTPAGTVNTYLPIYIDPNIKNNG